MKLFLLFLSTYISLGSQFSNSSKAFGMTLMGGHVGGGDATASDLQHIINKIDAYLLTDEGKSDFPEIKQPEFHNMVKQVRPVVKDERIQDEFGVKQTCISHAVEGNRFIQCDLSRLPSTELRNQPTLFRIMFHELLFQVGLERPISKDVPSDFRVSSRLKLHLKKKQEWVPGDSQGQPDESSSEVKRMNRDYLATLHFGAHGLEYVDPTIEAGFAKYLTPNSLLGIRFGQSRSLFEKQHNITLQYKLFFENSFYIAPELYYFDLLDENYNHFSFDSSRPKGLGIGARIGNQWNWDHFTLGCDWIGVSKTFEDFDDSPNSLSANFRLNVLNVYAGWSFEELPRMDDEYVY